MVNPNLSQAAQLSRKLKADGYSRIGDGKWRNGAGDIARISYSSLKKKYEIVIVPHPEPTDAA